MSDITRTVFLDSGEQKLELQKYRLRITEGPNKGEGGTFESRKITIGASPDNDLVLDDSAVSRFHAEVHVDDAGYLLRDLGSKNGTTVNSLRIREVFLENGAIFKVGKTLIKFELTDESAEVHFSGQERFGNMLGRSLAMREIFALLMRVAPTDYRVLVEGESGTGKELVAEAIAAASEQTAERVFKAAKTEEEMLDAYLSRAHLEHPEEGCVLAALGTDARRQPEVVRDAFAASSKGFIELIGEHTAKGDKSALSDEAIDTAIRMIGGMVLARLVDSEELSERILSIAKSRET